ncbi:MAG: amino acid permease, partial [Acinetobacter sp.]
HLKFIQSMKKLGQKTSFPALWSPAGNILVLGFILTILYIMWTQGFQESILMIPLWIVVMFGLFKLLKPKST